VAFVNPIRKIYYDITTTSLSASACAASRAAQEPQQRNLLHPYQLRPARGQAVAP